MSNLTVEDPVVWVEIDRAKEIDLDFAYPPR